MDNTDESLRQNGENQSEVAQGFAAIANGPEQPTQPEQQHHFEHESSEVDSSSLHAKLGSAANRATRLGFRPLAGFSKNTISQIAKTEKADPIDREFAEAELIIRQTEDRAEEQPIGVSEDFARNNAAVIDGKIQIPTRQYEEFNAQRAAGENPEAPHSWMRQTISERLAEEENQSERAKLYANIAEAIDQNDSESIVSQVLDAHADKIAGERPDTIDTLKTATDMATECAYGAISTLSKDEINKRLVRYYAAAFKDGRTTDAQSALSSISAEFVDSIQNSASLNPDLNPDQEYSRLVAKELINGPARQAIQEAAAERIAQEQPTNTESLRYYAARDAILNGDFMGKKCKTAPEEVRAELRGIFPQLPDIVYDKMLFGPSGGDKSRDLIIDEYHIADEMVQSYRYGTTNEYGLEVSRNSSFNDYIRANTNRTFYRYYGNPLNRRLEKAIHQAVDEFAEADAAEFRAREDYPQIVADAKAKAKAVYKTKYQIPSVNSAIYAANPNYLYELKSPEHKILNASYRIDLSESGWTKNYADDVRNKLRSDTDTHPASINEVVMERLGTISEDTPSIAIKYIESCRDSEPSSRQYLDPEQIRELVDSHPATLIDPAIEFGSIKDAAERYGVECTEVFEEAVRAHAFVSLIGILKEPGGPESDKAGRYFDTFFSENSQRFADNLRELTKDEDHPYYISPEIVDEYLGEDSEYQEFIEEQQHETETSPVSINRFDAKTFHQLVNEYINVTLKKYVDERGATETGMTFTPDYAGLSTTNNASEPNGLKKRRSQPFTFGAEKLNAICEYSDYIQRNFPDANLQRFTGYFGKDINDIAESNTKSSLTYIGFTFRYNDRLCVIAESPTVESGMYIASADANASSDAVIKEMFAGTKKDTKYTSFETHRIDHQNTKNAQASVQSTYDKAFHFFRTGEYTGQIRTVRRHQDYDPVYRYESQAS